MPQIIIEATEEQIKAVNGVVVDHKTWLQAAWNGKAANCTERVITEESNLNPLKLTDTAKSKWIEDNTFKTRKQKDIDSST